MSFAGLLAKAFRFQYVPSVFRVKADDFSSGGRDDRPVELGDTVGRPVEVGDAVGRPVEVGRGVGLAVGLEGHGDNAGRVGNHTGRQSRDRDVMQMMERGPGSDSFEFGQ